MVVAEMRQVAAASTKVGVVSVRVQDPLIPSDLGEIYEQSLQTADVFFRLDMVTGQSSFASLIGGQALNRHTYAHVG